MHACCLSCPYPVVCGGLTSDHHELMQGCDGSVLLDSANKTAEKDAQPNQTLRGFGFVERVKAAVEKACPDTVSCADILALIARDAVWLVSRVLAILFCK